MNSDARSVLVEETRDDVHLGLEWLEGLQAFAQFHLTAVSFRPPVVWMDTTGHKQSGKPFGKRLLTAVGLLGPPDGNGFEPRQRHGHARTAK